MPTLCGWNPTLALARTMAGYFAQTTAYFFLPALLTIAALSDLATLRIPNWISIAIVAGFALAAPLAGLSLARIGLHAGIGSAMLMVGFFIFARGWAGAGDIKLLVATVFWMGPTFALDYVSFAAVLGGVLAVLVLALQYFVPMFAPGCRLARHLHERGNTLPYGIALSAGALLVYPQTEIFRGLAMH